MALKIFLQYGLIIRWKSMFFHLPIENQIKHHQQEYYDAISKSHQEGSSTTFIEFMLDMIFAPLKN